MIAINDCLRLFSSYAALGALAIGCSGALDASAAENDELGLEAPTGAEGTADAPPPKRPPLCKTNAECTKGCPPESKGCTCHALPDGPSICVPTCSADADCPTGPGIPPLRCKEGVCAPPPPPKPPACQTDGDCKDKCPPGASCACREAPLPAKICVATCGADSDCPAIPGAPPLVCADGTCHPAKPPPPPSR